MKFVSHLGLYQERIDKTIKQRVDDHTMERIWKKDHTLWKPDPKEITNRLGWLDIADRVIQNVEKIEFLKKELIDEGFTHVLLLGMGGSSLAPEVFRKTFGFSEDDLDVDILDSTDPDSVRTFEKKLNPEKTLFVVSTKSGGTVETLSFFKYYYNWIQDNIGKDDAGKHFVAITDPGSSLQEMAGNYKFRHTFLNDPDIGGRFSALSYFGIVPAVFLGVPVRDVLKSAVDTALSSKNSENDGLTLGVILGEMALNSCDKVIFLPSPELSSFGDWAEQLIAESTGKEGKGILPVVGESRLDVDEYSQDRIFVFQTLKGNTPDPQLKKDLIEAGHPILEIDIQDLSEIGGLFYVWEMATAVACLSLKINPFDQPNVESAKVRARSMTAAFMETGQLPQDDPAEFSDRVLKDFLKDARPGHYIAIQVYAQSTDQSDVSLSQLRIKLTENYGVPVTIGYGPRFLHSTGQLHKGDGGNGYFIQITSENSDDLSIPDEAGEITSSMSFGVLKLSQALGDKQALEDAGRMVIRFHVSGNLSEKIHTLTNSL